MVSLLSFASYSRGFTLIELLVVVAIIGMISSVVLTSLGSARDKGGDAAVKQNMRTIMTQAALVFSNNGSYGTSFTVAACPSSGTTMFYADTIVRAAIAAAASAGNGTVAANTYCSTDGTDYAVSVKLRSSTNHWCVDNRGNSKQITPPLLGHTCP